MISSVYRLLWNHDLILFCDIPNLLKVSKADLNVNYWFLRMIWMIWCVFEIVMTICSFNTIPIKPFWYCSRIGEKAPSQNSVISIPKRWNMPQLQKSITVRCIRKMRLAMYLLIAVILIIFNFFSVTGNSGRVVLQILYLNLRLIHGAILKHMNISAKHAGKTLTKDSCIR